MKRLKAPQNPPGSPIGMGTVQSDTGLINTVPNQAGQVDITNPHKGGKQTNSNEKHLPEEAYKPPHQIAFEKALVKSGKRK